MILTREQFQEQQLEGMPPPVEGVSLSGQVVVITGANVGLGFEAAKHFAARGPQKLIIVCRNVQKGQDALSRTSQLFFLRFFESPTIEAGIKSDTGFQNIELWIADFASFDSVKALKGKIDTLERLDILVENAAILSYDYEETKDGWESSLQVNILALAHHIILHLPKLLETAKNYPETVPRIVVVSSDVHYWAKISPEVVEAAKPLKFLNVKAQYNP
ncbi:hypothetical protein V5O48_015024, partial [Marasmius crinis-equi]